VPIQPFLAGELKVDHFIERPGLALRGPGVITDMAWLAERLLAPGAPPHLLVSKPTADGAGYLTAGSRPLHAAVFSGRRSRVKGA
jgi:hypothetical protein